LGAIEGWANTGVLEQLVMPRLTGDLKERTLAFGVRIMDVVRRLPHEQRGWIVGKQLGRAGTSVGANVWEADAAITDAEFTNKISIARKEACEVEYWLELGFHSAMLSHEDREALRQEAMELAKILGAIVRRTQEHMKRK
jgi:four helix bundle protein